ncbi:extracellular solute-binding protein [Actinomadura spongiicola]|uniref:Extracellular solute-binding protein n=1 Tax=Actinomadura spongiicola TaxID=2303421 RepID=A0A372G6T7_9ACTN|nr:extracellular solute-binding protein [Actinomadura spongiicola]RFS81076.1 extracellular solute-binding protein [Actinomadura spongiicola]
MSNRLRLVAFLGFAITLLAMTVYGEATSAPSRCRTEGPLTVLGGRDDTGTRRALVQGWQPKDGTRAEFRELPSNSDLEHSELVSTARSATCAAEVFLIDTPWIPEFAEAGYIDPVGIPEGDLKAIIPEVLKTGRFRGKLWAVPLNTDAPLLIYRKDLVGKAPGTPEELMAAARALTARPKSPVTSGLMLQLHDYEGFTVNILELIRDLGGDITVSDDGTVTMDRGAVLATLRQLTAAMRGDRPPVSPASLDADENAGIDAFEQGKVAFLRDWPAFYTQLLTDGAKLGPDQIDAVPYPGERVLGGQSLAIAAPLPDDRARAARELITYLTDAPQQKRMFACGGLVPVRGDAYEPDAAACGGTHRKRLVLHADPGKIRDAVRGARARPSSAYYPEFSRVLRRHLHEYLRERLRCTAPSACPKAPDDNTFLNRLAAALDRAARGRAG